MNRVILSAAALALLAACAGPQSAPTAESAAGAPAANAAEGNVATDTGRWETEGSRDTLVRLKGPVGGWTSSRR